MTKRFQVNYDETRVIDIQKDEELDAYEIKTLLNAYNTLAQQVSQYFEDCGISLEESGVNGKYFSIDNVLEDIDYD